MEKLITGTGFAVIGLLTVPTVILIALIIMVQGMTDNMLILMKKLKLLTERY